MRQTFRFCQSDGEGKPAERNHESFCNYAFLQTMHSQPRFSFTSSTARAGACLPDKRLWESRIVVYLNFLIIFAADFRSLADMSRLSNRILLTLLFGLFFAVPQGVRSQGFDAKTLQRAQRNGQTGNLYGNNPYETPEGEEGEDQQPQDTTKKERKIRNVNLEAQNLFLSRTLSLSL